MCDTQTVCFFFFNDTATTEIYTLSLHDALPICRGFAIQRLMNAMRQAHADGWFIVFDTLTLADDRLTNHQDRKSGSAGMPRPISYAVFCLKKKNNLAFDTSESYPTA